MPNQVDISPVNSNQRIDKYLFRQYASLPKSVIHKLIRTGQIRVNSGRIMSGYLLRVGDKLRLPPTHVIDNLENKFGQAVKKRSIPYNEAKKFLIENRVYEDDDVIALDKPAGLACQGGTLVNVSLDDYLIDEYRLVHRLDRDTTGLVLIAKNYQMARSLTLLFKEKKVHKLYLAIVYALNLKKKGIIDDEDGYSEYIVLSSKYNIHLVAFFPISGKKRQIRQHISSLGGQLIGDRKFRLTNKHLKLPDFEQIKFEKKLMLHSTCLGFKSESGKKHLFYAKPSHHFIKFVDKYKLKLVNHRELEKYISKKLL